jgi:hypothetical protein
MFVDYFLLYIKETVNQKPENRYITLVFYKNQYIEIKKSYVSISMG